MPPSRVGVVAWGHHPRHYSRHKGATLARRTSTQNTADPTAARSAPVTTTLAAVSGAVVAGVFAAAVLVDASPVVVAADGGAGLPLGSLYHVVDQVGARVVDELRGLGALAASPTVVVVNVSPDLDLGAANFVRIRRA